MWNNKIKNNIDKREKNKYHFNKRKQNGKSVFKIKLAQNKFKSW